MYSLSPTIPSTQKIFDIIPVHKTWGPFKSMSMPSMKQLKRILYIALIADAIIVPAVFAKLFLPITTPFAEAAAQSQVITGPATQQLLNQLTMGTSTATAIKQITRKPLTVPGTLVGINGDNMQVFEYPDHNRAFAEATILSDKYTNSKHSSTWRYYTHLYVDNTLVIFYMGNQASILAPLSQKTELPLRS